MLSKGVFMNKTDIAESIFNNNFNCAQAVLLSFSSRYGLNDETAYKISCGFGGGMARLQNTCGAVTGAIMVLGLEYGMSRKEDGHLKEKTYGLVQEFTKEFEKRNKTTSCRELLGCDLRTEAGQEVFKKNKLHRNICLKCVKDSVEILENLLSDKYI
jgi:C_GCAxxG_C_C family probable redox protein